MFGIGSLTSNDDQSSKYVNHWKFSLQVLKWGTFSKLHYSLKCKALFFTHKYYLSFENTLSLLECDPLSRTQYEQTKRLPMCGIMIIYFQCNNNSMLKKHVANTNLSLEVSVPFYFYYFLGCRGMLFRLLFPIVMVDKKWTTFNILFFRSTQLFLFFLVKDVFSWFIEFLPTLLNIVGDVHEDWRTFKFL